MTIEVDVAGEETNALFTLADFSGRRVLEIGSGDGRLTWRYARMARRVTTIEPFRPSFERALTSLPDDLRDTVTLRHTTFGDVAASSLPASFDLALLSWTL